MATFSKILVPVDLTDKNHEAILTARDLALASEGDVWLFHVIEELDAPREDLEDFYGGLEARARAKLQQFAEPLRAAGVSVGEKIAYGHRAVEIVQFAREHEFDLVVMTSHRIDPEHLARSMMTISHQVAIVADPPVLLLR